MFTEFAIGISLSVFLVGTYLIWFSKKNIFNHSVLGLCFVAYLVPAFVIKYDDYSTPDVIRLYVIINLLGCFTYLSGMLLGYRIKTLIAVNTLLQFRFLSTVHDNEHGIQKIRKVSSIIYVAALGGIIISYILMGFVPLFAANPFMAKFFKGEYQAPYERVAFLYRTARQLLEFLMPLRILELFINFNLKSVILVLSGILLIAVSLNRGPILSGFLVAISIFVALKKNNGPFWIYLIIVFSSYILGSGVYYLLGLAFPDSFFGDAANVGFFEAVAMGAPDITDQLSFLSAFLDSGSHYSYGLTFFGGLIPFNFPWNPSVYTLTILNSSNDISEVASGGLRLPVSLWGYISFGWIGVALVPFFSGVFTGYIVKKVKRIINTLRANESGYVSFFLIQFVFSNIAVVFTNFYFLSIYSLPAFVLFYTIIMAGKTKNKELTGSSIVTYHNKQ
ncbi:O-antigen polymerase [Mucilaginibacter sp. RCC_168]|uniref:O-antigen polymerase n=1 Tax=Mucilaginibacter sp. RCC_168 TaxID=3239221 RepID=UPI0035239F6A